MYSFIELGNMGRLGNQMFQFATTLALGHIKNQNVHFPIEKNSRLPEVFPATKEYFRPLSQIFVSQRYNEIDFRFCPEVHTLPPGTDLYGYFQTEKYFDCIRDKILALFSFSQEIDKIALEVWQGLRFDASSEKETISLHVRRGDYLLYPNHHPTCSLDYYQQAISRFNQDSLILVFSDDIGWCRQNFTGDRFYFIDTKSDLVDLKLMTMCDHHIIANSSYSWWGAWLNPNQNKQVIAPSNWFGPEIRKNPEDVYCRGWQVI